MTYYQIKSVAPDRAEVRIDGTIGGGWFDEDPVTAKSFAKELKAAGKVKNLDIYINSPGGSVFDGSAIYSQLKRHTAKKTVYVEGLAASIASMIAMAGDEVVMPDNALMMIHRASGGVLGTANDMRKTADVLEKVESSIIAAYQAKTGRDPEELAEMMADETWMTAQEAVALGFADRTTDPITVTACADAATLRSFKYVPPALRASAPPVSSASSQEPAMPDDPIIESPAPAAESDPQPEREVAPDQPQAAISAPDPAVAAPVVDMAALRAEVLTAESARRAAIRALVTPALLARPGVRACLDACLDDPDLSADAASRRLLAELGKTAEPLAVTATLTAGIDPNAPLEDRCRGDWQQDPALRNEFPNFDAYLAYRKAEAAGQVHIFKR